MHPFYHIYKRNHDYEPSSLEKIIKQPGQKMGRLTLIVVMVMSSLMLGGKSQQIINTPCTSSMISTFTPCLNFITGSSGGSITPTAGCCDSLKALTNTGMECACLILTANVPLPTSVINRTLALGLPRACKMSGVPVQCQGF